MIDFYYPIFMIIWCSTWAYFGVIFFNRVDKGIFKVLHAILILGQIAIGLYWFTKLLDMLNI